MVPWVMPMASLATDHPFARVSRAASTRLAVDPVRVDGDERDQQRALRRGKDPRRADEHQLVGHRNLEPDGYRGRYRDRPA
jgi:hypothetical protein